MGGGGVVDPESRFGPNLQKVTTSCLFEYDQEKNVWHRNEVIKLH